MRNFISLAAAVIVLTFAALLFSSCVQNNTAETTEPPPIEWSSAEVFTQPDDNASEAVSEPVGTERDGGESDAQIKAVVHEALDAYSLFISTVPEIDRDDSVEYEEGLIYYKVTDERFNTFDKIKSYMLNYFSEDIVTQLLNVERYMQLNGGSLYVLDINMSSGAKILSEKFVVKEKAKDKETYTVTVVKDKNGDGTADATETYDLIREPTKDDSDKWVFKQFTYYR